MHNQQLKPLFNAAYLAIFLKFVQTTYRKLNPYKIRFRRRYIVTIPRLSMYIVAGSYDNLDAAVGQLNDLINACGHITYELLDLERMFGVVLNSGKQISASYINAAWNGIPPKAWSRPKVSIFDLNEHNSPPEFPPAYLRMFRSIATAHRQNFNSTTLESLIA